MKATCSLSCHSFLVSSAVLSDPAKRLDYDLTGICEIDKYTLPVWTFANLISVTYLSRVMNIYGWYVLVLHNRNILADLEEWYLHAMAWVLVMHQHGNVYAIVIVWIFLKFHKFLRPEKRKKRWQFLYNNAGHNNWWKPMA